MTRELAWKDRCRVIILTSSSPKSTFDDSNVLAITFPKAPVPGAPFIDEPEPVVSTKRLLPTVFNPSGLLKRVRATCPMALVVPFVNRAVIFPSLPIEVPTRVPFALPSCASVRRLEVDPNWVVPSNPAVDPPPSVVMLVPSQM